jgi:phenylacetate-CoA ligase
MKESMNLPTPHAGFTGAIWPAVPRAPAAAFLALLEQLARSQYLDAGELETARLPQIAALAGHASRTFPFWEKRLSKAGLGPGATDIDLPTWKARWAELPVLIRAEVQELGDKLRTTRVPAGHGHNIESVTSGSSGRPVRFVRTTLDFFYLQAFQLREHVWRRRNLFGKFLSIVRDGERKEPADGLHLRQMENWGPPASVVWPTGPFIMVDYRAPVSALIDTIREHAPDYLCSFPSLLFEIARQARDSGIQLPPLREVIGMGEASPPELAELCLEVWGAPYTSTYSAAECGGIAYECLEAGRWHIQSERSVVEVLDAENQPCQPGETGRVVLTPLHNFAMPLFRYEIGDLATVGEGACPCGRKLPVLAAIPGRARDLLMLPSGELRPPYYGHGAVMKVRAIRQHQVIQTSPREICFRLVVAQPLTAQDEQHIIGSASESIGKDFSIRIEYVPEILRQASGKFAEFERAF